MKFDHTTPYQRALNHIINPNETLIHRRGYSERLIRWRTGKYHIRRVSGKPVILFQKYPFKFFITQNEYKIWNVTEERTGASIASSITQKGALTVARKTLRSQGLQNVKYAVNDIPSI